jgi:predicted ATPase
LLAQAVPYWRRAGQRAIQHSANLEAAGHLNKGLELLKTLPDNPERTQQELVLQTTLGPALMAIKGYAAPEVEQTYARARELCRQMGETPQLFPVLWGLWLFYTARAELQTARELGEQCLTLAQHQQDPTLLLAAHRALGQTLFYLGELALSRAHLEQGIALYDAQQHGFHAFLYGQDQGVMCMSRAALTLWVLGFPDQALKRSHGALTLAQELSHPFSLAVALSLAAYLYQFRREGQATQNQAEAAMTLSTEQGFALWSAGGTILRGWALAEQGQDKEGIVQIQQGLAAWQATGMQASRTYMLAQLAEAYGKVGQAEEGLTVLAEALTVVNHSGERHYEAELYRLKGEFLLKSNIQGLMSEVEKRALDTPPGASEAEACFQQALNIARHQQAKSLELRATMSLSRLWQHQGQHDEARHLLADVYGWFTEGFDTADLQEAKALLEELEG